ncbi:hypothetical protein K0T92_10535 [Paenibacillus oenotherae]|uniref:ABC transporter domain-containing protein n=1 Tax=Paenibacillus oenotherae TaxID=1435645 RepID=A0ABS7D5H5_9BACL|nr:hypothetical protein [Paenibacillus oenotherae]MBW7475184.1 hypothetical protein [Paenibacillus oenotherae]
MIKIHSISVKNLNISCTATIFNMRSIKEEIAGFTYSFIPGKVYGLIGKAGMGAWAISYVLAGNSSAYSGSISINGIEADTTILRENGWYVGEQLKRRGLLGMSKSLSVLQELERGKQNAESINNWIQQLELSPTRLNRPIENISNERWNASVAIGLAQGKSLFCFPWFDQEWKELLRVRLATCAELLKKQGCIMIIPSDSPLVIERFVDEFIYLK